MRSYLQREDLEDLLAEILGASFGRKDIRLLVGAVRAEATQVIVIDAGHAGAATCHFPA